MSQLTQNTILSAGLATLALACAPAAYAQIQVTGGSVAGQAAFFKDTGTNQITTLFDLSVENLQIVSQNGVLTNPLFQPTATGGFTDGGTAGTVDFGDTGLIVGNLSGLAFTQSGLAIPFSQVNTALAYNVSLFNSSSTVPGTLIDGETIPQLFIPVAGITTSATGITATDGEMEIGDLNANIATGFIDLPSTLEFRGSSGVTTSPFAVFGNRKIKFEFEGENVAYDDFAFAGNELDFAGEANRKFKIETFGDGNSTAFELDASNGYVDIQVGNINETGGNSDLATLIAAAGGTIDKYEIKGQTNGLLAMFAPGQVAVQGSGRNVRYEFQDGGLDAKGNTSGNGDVTFFAAAGAGSVSIDEDTTVFTASNFSSFQSAVSTTEYSYSRNTNEVDFVSTSVPFGNLTLAFNGSFTLDGSSTFSTTATTSLTEIQSLLTALLEELGIDNLGNSATISLFTAEGSDTVRYEIASAPTYKIRIRQNRRGDLKIKVRVHNRRGRRFFVALRGDNLAGCFEQVGTSSRIFAGLQGLRQLSDEEAAEIYEELQLADADDDADDDSDDDADDDGDDDADDSDDDADDDSDDDADDSDDDADDDSDDDADDDSDDDADDDSDDDADDDSDDEDPAVAPAPVFEGLDSLSPEEVDAINEQIDSFGAEPADSTEPDAADATSPTDGTDTDSAN